METIELIEIFSRGEDSKHQFKKDITSPEKLAAEMVAFSNSSGGQIFVGVDDNGSVSGLSGSDVSRINQLISNTASQGIMPAINPETENIETGNGLVVVVTVSEGVAKPYQDKAGAFWVKSGADKRKATSREEIQRIFQRANLLHADEIPVQGLSAADLHQDYFAKYFFKRYNKRLGSQEISLQQVLENLGLHTDGHLTLAGALLFAKTPQYKCPAFRVKAAVINGVSISADEYLDNKDIEGKIEDIFTETVRFIMSNLHHVQGEQGVNSVGVPEVPQDTIEELVANAIVHRDYFVSAPIRVFIFRDRVEIISPGHLPNTLAVNNIKSGVSVPRNPLLASHAYYLIPYHGYGSGVLRAIEKYPDIDFVDDRDGNLFKAVINRH